MSDAIDVQEYIEEENARRGRGPENEGREEGGDGGDDAPEGEGEEGDRLERMKKRIFGDEEGGDGRS